MPPRNAPSDSDSDTEEDKRRMQQMRDSVEQSQVELKKAEPVSVAAETAAAAASAVDAAQTADTAAATAAAAANTNPFYTLLLPPVPSFFKMTPKPVSDALKANPTRVSFLAHIDAQIASQRLQLERRRRQALHGLSSNRLSTDDGDDLAASGPRVLNSFEQSVLRRLTTSLSRDLDTDSETWRDETDAQRTARLAGEEAQKEFVIMKRYPTGSFLTETLDLTESTCFGGTPAPAAAAAASGVEDAAARKARKLEKKARRDAIVAAGGVPETAEERRLRKEKKQAKREKRAAATAGGDAANKKAKTTTEA